MAFVPASQRGAPPKAIQAGHSRPDETTENENAICLYPRGGRAANVGRTDGGKLDPAGTPCYNRRDMTAVSPSHFTDFAVGQNQTLVCLGDSITQNSVGYCPMIAALIAASYPERNIRVINAGIGGHKITDLWRGWTGMCSLTSPTG
jgi:hypothetical protein